jgi:S-DNA-T family DNA segregation ATPase FtsK/SpoIIIE
MFCDNLKRIRKKSSKTQREIAEYLNISAQSISKWETGESLPTIDYLPHLAAFLGCSVNTFFDEDELCRFEADGVLKSKFEKTNDFKDKIEDAFMHFGIKAEVVEVIDSVRITTYKMLMYHGVGIRDVLKRVEDIRYYIGVSNARFITDAYRGRYFAIEVAKTEFNGFGLTNDEIKDILKPLNYQLPVIFGKDTENNVITGDVAKLPHLAIGGASGTGKSMLLWCIFKSLSVCMSEQDVKFVIFDAKNCEFSALKNNEYLYCDIVKDADTAVKVLENIISEIDRRFALIEAAGVRNIEAYNQLSLPAMPSLVIMIDELVDFVVAKPEVENLLLRITMKGRAAGVHLIVATAIPTSAFLSGVVLCNIPSRISFKTHDKKDSVRVIDNPDALLLGAQGDMLYTPVGHTKPTRIQGVDIL